MSRVCQITGKRAMGGNHVSHSKRRVKRTFSINLFKRNFYWPEEDRWIRLNVSADGLRLINKRGLNACLKDATAAGLIKKLFKITDDGKRKAKGNRVQGIFILLTKNPAPPGTSHFPTQNRKNTLERFGGRKIYHLF